MSYYQLRSFSEGTYVISKLDDDMNPESVYQCSVSECNCPAGGAPSCRHRKMIPIFEASHHIDDGWLFCYERSQWIAPIMMMDDEPAQAEDTWNDGKDYKWPSDSTSPMLSTPTTTETLPSTVESAPTTSIPPPAISSSEGSAPADGAKSFRRRF